MADIKFISGEGKPRVVVVHATGAQVGDGGWTYNATAVFSTNIGANYGVRVGMRVYSHKVISGQPNKKVWGKVTAMDAGSLTIDQWIGGTPTNAQVCYSEGWVIDLPYCTKDRLVETFTPEQLVHHLYRNRKDEKSYGWSYEAKLSYEEHIEADVLLSLRPALNKRTDDRLILIPRVDRPHRGYNVYYGGAIKIARQSERGHSLVALTFVGKESVPFPIPNSGYGFGYAKNYGHQL